MCCIIAAGAEYRHIAMLKGDVTLLWCNTRSDEVIWTRNTTDGDFSFVYNNRSIQGRFRRRLSIVGHSLRIYNTKIGDSGCYVCYESDGVQIFGYDLNVIGKKMTNNI